MRVAAEAAHPMQVPLLGPAVQVVAAPEDRRLPRAAASLLVVVAAVPAAHQGERAVPVDRVL